MSAAAPEAVTIQNGDDVADETGLETKSLRFSKVNQPPTLAYASWVLQHIKSMTSALYCGARIFYERTGAECDVLATFQGWWHDLFIGKYDYTFLCTPVWPYPWMCGREARFATTFASLHASGPKCKTICASMRERASACVCESTPKQRSSD